MLPAESGLSETGRLRFSPFPARSVQAPGGRAWKLKRPSAFVVACNGVVPGHSSRTDASAAGAPALSRTAPSIAAVFADEVCCARAGETNNSKTRAAAAKAPMRRRRLLQDGSLRIPHDSRTAGIFRIFETPAFIVIPGGALAGRGGAGVRSLRRLRARPSLRDRSPGRRRRCFLRDAPPSRYPEWAA